MTVITAVIRKDRLKRKYKAPENPYQLGLLFCLEKAHRFLEEAGAHATRCHVVCESRSPKAAGQGKEDKDLELEFRRIVAGDHYLAREHTMPCFDIVFASKLANSTGLQIADMIARPIGLRVLRGAQENRAFDIINPKIWRGPQSVNLQFGMKVFP